MGVFQAGNATDILLCTLHGLLTNAPHRLLIFSSATTAPQESSPPSVPSSLRPFHHGEMQLSFKVRAMPSSQLFYRR